MNKNEAESFKAKARIAVSEIKSMARTQAADLDMSPVVVAGLLTRAAMELAIEEGQVERYVHMIDGFRHLITSGRIMDQVYVTDDKTP